MEKRGAQTQSPATQQGAVYRLKSSEALHALDATRLVTLDEIERQYIVKVLDQTGWVIKGGNGAAQILGLHEATLRSRMKKLGIQRPTG
jgi:transcriptional regulator with GAF, ATPase, and Fis domain